MCTCKKTNWRRFLWPVFMVVDAAYAVTVCVWRRTPEITAGQRVRCLQMRLAHADATSALFNGDAWRPASYD